MAIREARCTNCGSLLTVDAATPAFKCMFCRAVVDTQEGMDVAIDAEGYDFPNDPQPDEEDELNPASIYNKALKNNQPARPKTTSKKTQSGKQASPTHKKEAASKARVEKIEMPSVKISTSAKIKIAAVLVGLLLITAAAVMPVTMVRDAHRRNLVEKVDSIIPFDYDGENAYTISMTGNYRFTVVAQDDVDPTIALQVYRSFSEARAEVYGLDLHSDSFNKVYGKVLVQVIGPNGGYEVSGLETEADLDNVSLVVTMD